MNTNIDEHLDEVLGVINMPKKEITKVEKVKPRITKEMLEKWKI